MSKKRTLALALAGAMSVSMLAACGGGNKPAAGGSSAGGAGASGGAADYSDVSIGSCIYKYDDTFMTGVRTNMQAKADELGVKLELVDSQNKQPTQNEQVDTFTLRVFRRWPSTR